MKYLFLLLSLIFVNQSYSQTVQVKELNKYYKDNKYFNKKYSEISDLIMIGNYNDTKVYNLKFDTEYFGNIKLTTKPKYFFFKGFLHYVIYYIEFGDLKSNVEYISKLFYDPDGYTEVYPDILRKETEKKYFWNGNYMTVEVTKGEIRFEDKRVDGQVQINTYESWWSLGY